MSNMNKKIITIIFALAAVCSGANAQWKQGDVPPSSRRGSIAPTEIDKAEVTVYYAFNASDIKDESTYIDLGWLQVGKQYTKYASYFVAHSDSTYKPKLIKNSNGESASVYVVDGQQLNQHFLQSKKAAQVALQFLNYQTFR